MAKRALLVDDNEAAALRDLLRWQRSLRGAGGIEINGATVVYRGRKGGGVGGGLSGEEWTGLIDSAVKVSANRWTYTVTQAMPTDDGWYELVDSTSSRYRVEVTNRLEDQNTDSGLLGIGIDIGDIPQGFFLQPIPAASAPVNVFAEVYSNNEKRWRMHEYNGIGGRCPDNSVSLAMALGQ